MKTTRMILVSTAWVFAARAGVIDQQKGRLDADDATVWYDAQLLPIEGKAFADTESYYDRLPARAKDNVPAPVWSLSRNSAGMALHFCDGRGVLQSPLGGAERKPRNAAYAGNGRERSGRLPAYEGGVALRFTCRSTTERRWWSLACRKARRCQRRPRVRAA